MEKATNFKLGKFIHRVRVMDRVNELNFKIAQCIPGDHPNKSLLEILQKKIAWAYPGTAHF